MKLPNVLMWMSRRCYGHLKLTSDIAMRTGYISELNQLFSDFQNAGRDYENHIGKGTSNESESGKILKTDIPLKLKELFPKELYKIKGSIGTGRISRCPWVAIMHHEETSSTKHGIYLVFLFSKDLKRIYLSLAQGVSELSKQDIINTRDAIRSKLNLENTIRRHFNDQLIDSDEYNASAIYSNEWNINDESHCESLILQFKDAYEQYILLKNKVKANSLSVTSATTTLLLEQEFSIEEIINCIKKTGLVYSENLIIRFVLSLMAKPFVILSGLSGSGKTQLAIAFAKAICENVNKQVRVVPVGADWTNREPLLGYPNALESEKYVRPESGVLQLIQDAVDDESHPYFLVLDEMNLSYVERYFADFLSAMESHEPIPLWDKEDDETPKSVELPKNLFIIGTINVDETTYMFSPKVLDRANVIEFKISEKEMSSFLDKVPNVQHSNIEGALSSMAVDFVSIAKSSIESGFEDSKAFLIKFFSQLKNVNAEFGYRSATEIGRFIALAKEQGHFNENNSVDAAIVQKLLPKLHGSRKKLVPVLTTLWDMCETGIGLELAEGVPEQTNYPLTADKLLRMYRGALDNGFTSFAEA